MIEIYNRASKRITLKGFKIEKLDNIINKPNDSNDEANLEKLNANIEIFNINKNRIDNHTFKTKFNAV